MQAAGKLSHVKVSQAAVSGLGMCRACPRVRGCSVAKPGAARPAGEAPKLDCHAMIETVDSSQEQPDTVNQTATNEL